MSSKELNTNNEIVTNEKERPHCLNCGAELNGPFCHMCGQELIDPNPTVGSFVSVYLDNAYMLDTKLIKTIWNLVTKPGHLAKEFLSGKVISNIHPLKLNMFLLFVFITMFFIFADTDAMEKPFDNIMRDEKVVPDVQMSLLQDDGEYVAKMIASPRDSVQMYAPLQLASDHSTYISLVEVIEDNEGDAMDRWIAVIPRCLIEDEIVMLDQDGYYYFNADKLIARDELEIIQDIGSKMFNIVTTYLPILVLLTTPFLSLALAVTQRKSKHSFIYHFVFSLYFTAFLEFMILFIYVLYLVAAPPIKVLEWIMILSLFFYMAAAIRRAYDTRSWIKSIIKAIFVNIVYLFNCAMVFLMLVIVVCVLVIIAYV